MTADLQPFDPSGAMAGYARADGSGVVDAASASALAPARDAAGVAARSVAIGALGWRAAVRWAAVEVRERPELIGVALLGFLARGGLVAFLLPIVVLPTPTGISNFIGGTALTGAGASDPLIRLIALGITLVVVVLLAGVTLGAVADVQLARAALALGLARAAGAATDEERDLTRREAAAAIPVTRSLIGRLVAVRLITLVPVGLAVAWGTSRLVAAGYHQLILPDDVSVPLALRILIEALDAAVVVVAVWLASELVGGIAVRHAIVSGRSVPGALAATVTGLVRRPATSVATYVLGVVGIALTAGPTLLVAAVLWSRLQALLSEDTLVLLAIPTTFLFVLAWGGGLALVGVVAAWRSLLGSLDVLRARGSAAAGGRSRPPNRSSG